MKLWFCPGRYDLLLTLAAGKHVRVWTGSHSTVLHRSPPLVSAYSASFSSLTHAAHTFVASFISLGLGSDLLMVPSNNSCKILLFWSAKSPLCSCVCGERVDQRSVFFALLLAFVVAWVQDMEREMCQVCMLLERGQLQIHVGSHSGR